MGPLDRMYVAEIVPRRPEGAGSASLGRRSEFFRSLGRRNVCSPYKSPDFLRRTAALGAALPFAVRGLPVFAAGPDLISRRLLFDNPDYVNVRVSPDGQHLAYLAPLDGVRNLWVAPLADPQAGRPLTRATNSNLSFY